MPDATAKAIRAIGAGNPMNDLQTRIESALRSAVVHALGEAQSDADPMVTPATNPKFGDYQANLAMGLAKRMGASPRQLAESIVAAIETGDLIASAEVAGPGFINLRLTGHALGGVAAAMHEDPRLGVVRTESRQRVVVDYSAPNVAKEMHVGHLRSTIIGDAIVRVLEFIGHDVVRQNHVGDWGTQFGMLIENLLEQGYDPHGQASPGDLTAIYKAARQRFDSEPDFAERARRRVVALQGGDERTLDVWRALVAVSAGYFQSIYDRMDVRLTRSDIRGESFYNDRLPGLVERLDREGHLKISEGAAVVFPEGFAGKEGSPLPLIVRKSDGGYLYATTDLAAAVYRVEELSADRLIYVIGLPQKQHVEMFTQVLRQAGWVGEQVRIDFVGFGSVLGSDRKMFKSRSGDTVRLIELLDEAEHRAAEALSEKNPDLSDDERRQIAHVVGVGALKYADLSSDRVKDYVFDWQRMLAMDGNTAPYMIYSYVRARSIARRAAAEGQAADSMSEAAFVISDPSERRLVLQLAQFPRVVDGVAESLEPHRMCGYLFELATAFHHFFERCPVLRAQDEALRASRLALCDLVARTLQQGLGLLGIGTVERM
jgi:arginyl-tRNA synthetase